MNAKEARTLTDKNIIENTNRGLDVILNEIAKCAKDEKYTAYFDNWIGPTLKARLESMGYKVENGSHYNESYSNVSW